MTLDRAGRPDDPCLLPAQRSPQPLQSNLSGDFRGPLSRKVLLYMAQTRSAAVPSFATVKWQERFVPHDRSTTRSAAFKYPDA